MRSHGVSVNFVVYDLLPILLPQHVVPGASEAHSKWLNMVAGTDSAICISRSVASELKIWLDQNSTSISKSFDIKWFHLGGDEEQLNESVTPDLSLKRGVIERLISAPSFLSVGTIEPRKGHAQLLASFELLWSEGCDVNLIFVGKQGWKVDDLIQKMTGHPELGKRFFWLDGISDFYLQEIYKSCTCLIASSEGEGFGLPLIEAAHKGMPIIARNIPVFQEVAGQHAYYFNGATPKDLAKCIQEWLELSKVGGIPRSENMPWLTWKESADQLLEGLGIRR
jgi:glycosyltransferase involved in cell wall biosynthesis